MEINNTHQKAQVSGVESRKFGFEMNAKMYDILISKMYTNKQGAVIRELSANAWDAHVDAGNSSVPFDLHLPTWLDKSFYIRDYGTGIPHDLFEHIYTNVGSSTKEDSNEFIGGFGLGSKTPFTMTDTFMVENHYEGIKTTWVCFKDKGEPQVSKVAEEPTQDPSGLKVSFSFDEGDVSEFTKQVVKQLKYFPVKPNITGGEGTVEFIELPQGWETQDYFYTDTSTDSYSGNESNVVMGNVSYVLNKHAFDYSYYDLFSKRLTIRVPIGAVDIPPSREHLEMTPKTKAYIENVLDRIKKEYTKDAQVKINSCSTEWEVRKVIYDLHFSLLFDKESMTWNNQELKWHILRTAGVSSIAGYTTKSIQTKYTNVYRAKHVPLRSAIDGKYDYYINDLGRGFSKYINEEYHKYNLSSAIIFHLGANVTDKNRGTKVTQAIKEINAEMGVKPKLLSSILGMPPTPVKSITPSGKAETNQVFKISGILQQHKSLKSQMEECDSVPTDGYYCELKHWSIETPTGMPLISEMLTHGLTEFLGKPLYAVRTKTIKKLGKGMKPLTKDILNKLEQDIIDKHKEVEYLRKVKLHVHSITTPHTIITSVLKERSLRAYVRYSRGVVKKADEFKGNTASLYRSIFQKSITYTPVLPEKLQVLREKYGVIHDLLSLVCNSYNSERNTKRATALANLILNNQ